MAKVKFSRIESSENINNIPLVDGQLIYTKDGKAYLDYGSERIEIVSGGDTTPVGAISVFAEVDETSPLMSDWVICDGRELSRTDYSQLFNVIGIKYGAGDGVSTFNVPNISDETINGKYYIKAFRSASSTAGVKNAYTESDTDTYSCNYVNSANLLRITTGEITKTGRIIDNKEEYVLRNKIILGDGETSSNNKRWTVPTNLTASEVTLTKEAICFLRANSGNTLSGNMVRFDGPSQLADTCQYYYYEGATGNVIFETAGTDRKDSEFIYEIYFIYND